jgi:organic hydroperoxide reductase OsmC/OhrA
MSEHTAVVEWVRGDQPFTDHAYSRAHDWRFDGGAVVRGSSAPTSVPVPMSDPAAVDPEEALVAALSSCHMLFFLALAAKAGFVVDRYRDAASAILGRDDRGRMSITEVVLRPAIDWSGDAPDAAQLGDLHHQSHRLCYIANSIRAEVRIEPG